MYNKQYLKNGKQTERKLFIRFFKMYKSIPQYIIAHRASLDA